MKHAESKSSLTPLEEDIQMKEFTVMPPTPPTPLVKRPELHRKKTSTLERTLDVLSPEEEMVGADYFSSGVGTSSDARMRHRRPSIIPPVDEKDNLMFGSELDPTAFPDGGVSAYLVLLGSFFGLISAFGIPNSLGAIQSYVSSHQLKDVDQTSVGWVFSLHLGVMYFGGVFFGEVFDIFGARWPLTIGGIVTCVGLILTAELTTLVHFIFSFAVLTALGTLVSMSPLIGVLLHWFLRKRAMACSVATIGGLLGGTVFPVMLQQLYDRVGFKWALRTLGLLCLACMAISVAFCKERSRRSHIKLPEQLDAESSDTPVSETVDGEGIAAKETNVGSFFHSLTSFFKGLLDFKVLLDKRFIFLTLAVWLLELISMTTLTFLSSYALEFGVGDSQAYLLLTIVNVCGIPSRFVLGILADKFGRFNVMLGTSIAMTIVIWGLWLPAKGHMGLLYAFGVLFGISSSAVILLIPACAGQICSADNFGKTYGTLYFFLGFLTILGMYWASLVISDGTQTNYTNFVYYEGALAAAGICVWLVARWSAVGFKLCKF